LKGGRNVGIELQLDPKRDNDRGVNRKRPIADRPEGLSLDRHRLLEQLAAMLKRGQQ
jgi:hypothetical protein